MGLSPLEAKTEEHSQRTVISERLFRGGGYSEVAVID